MRITVTLARQLGCGGSYLGQCIAENLKIRCLDREIVSQAAQKFSLDEAELAAREERATPFWERMLRGISASPPEALYHAPLTPSVSDLQLLTAETEVMKTIAAQEDCVIVGRLSSYVLPSHPGMVNISLHAPLDFRIRRLLDNGQAADDAEARSLLESSDKTRRRYITQMVGRGWDDASNYHLAVDTSALPLRELSDLLTDFVRRKTDGLK